MQSWINGFVLNIKGDPSSITEEALKNFLLKNHLDFLLKMQNTRHHSPEILSVVLARALVHLLISTQMILKYVIRRLHFEKYTLRCGTDER